MNYFKVSTICFSESAVFPLTIDSVMSRRLPFIQILGCSSQMASQLREKVVAAIEHQGIRLPNRKITVNIGALPERSSSLALELPIALSILGTAGFFPQSALEKVLVYGNLGLDGAVLESKSPEIDQNVLITYRSAILSPDKNRNSVVGLGKNGRAFQSLGEIIGHLKGFKEENADSVAAKPSFSAVQVPEYLLRPVSLALLGNFSTLFIDFRPERWQNTLRALNNQNFFRLQTHRTSSVKMPWQVSAKESVYPANFKVSCLSSAAISSWIREYPRAFSESDSQIVVAPLCSCGFPPNSRRRCNCKPAQVHRLQRGLQRLVEEYFPISADLSHTKIGNAAVLDLERVEAIQRITLQRQGGLNGMLSSDSLLKQKEWRPRAKLLYDTQEASVGYAVKRFQNIGKVALTISDWEGVDEVREEDVLEALHYQWESP